MSAISLSLKPACSSAINSRSAGVSSLFIASRSRFEVNCWWNFGWNYPSIAFADLVGAGNLSIPEPMVGSHNRNTLFIGIFTNAQVFHLSVSPSITTNIQSQDSACVLAVNVN
jgi:hypothetical protein